MGVHRGGTGAKWVEDGRQQSSEASTKFANTKNNNQNSRVSNLYAG